MYNKLLADLIRDRLNNELEKIKLELFEDDYYAQDIEDSVDVVKTQLSGEQMNPDDEVVRSMPSDTTEAPVNVSPVIPDEKISNDNAQFLDGGFQEMDLSKNDIENKVSRMLTVDDNVSPDTIPEPSHLPKTKTEHYDTVKIAGAAMVVASLLVTGAYFLIF